MPVWMYCLPKILCAGFVALIWCTVWLVCITESPIDDKHITKEELKYIVDSIGPVDGKKSKIAVPTIFKCISTNLI